MNECKHEFVGGPRCAHCGRTVESIKAQGYDEAMNLLRERAKDYDRMQRELQASEARVRELEVEFADTTHQLLLQISANDQAHRTLELTLEKHETQISSWKREEESWVERLSAAESEARALRKERDAGEWGLQTRADCERLDGEVQRTAARLNAAEIEARALRERIERVTRWHPCEVDSEDEDGPVYQGFLTDEVGAWVKWEDVLEALRGS